MCRQRCDSNWLQLLTDQLEAFVPGCYIEHHTTETTAKHNIYEHNPCHTKQKLTKQLKHNS